MANENGGKKRTGARKQRHERRVDISSTSELVTKRKKSRSHNDGH